jgi:DNA-binding SARP family transcriptional activator
MLHGHSPRRHGAAPGAEPPSVTITVLGGFEVIVNGVPTATHGWSRRSAAALVKILALAPGHRLHREQVIDLLWPGEPVAAVAPRLHKAAHYARRAVGRDDAIVLRDDVVWLLPGADLTVDAVRFEQLSKQALAERDATAARAALASYRGELLPGDRYEDWAVDRRELLHLRHLDLLRLTGDWWELTELDPTDEDAHAALIRRHLDGGDGSAALRHYAWLEQLLDRELGVAPTAHVVEALVGAEAADEPRVARLLAELGRVVARQTDLLAELAAVAAAPDRCLPIAS